MRERWGIPEDEFYIKRLVGLPGERVQIGDDRREIGNVNKLVRAIVGSQHVGRFSRERGVEHEVGKRVGHARSEEVGRPQGQRA